MAKVQVRASLGSAGQEAYRARNVRKHAVPLAFGGSMWLNKHMKSILGMLLLVSATFAQAPTGEIAGTVFDASGGVVPNAAIRVKSAATAFERSLRSNQSGQYSVP